MKLSAKQSELTKISRIEINILIRTNFNDTGPKNLSFSVVSLRDYDLIFVKPTTRISH